MEGQLRDPDSAAACSGTKVATLVLVIPASGQGNGQRSTHAPRGNNVQKGWAPCPCQASGSPVPRCSSLEQPSVTSTSWNYSVLSSRCVCSSSTETKGDAWCLRVPFAQPRKRAALRDEGGGTDAGTPRAPAQARLRPRFRPVPQRASLLWSVGTPRVLRGRMAPSRTYDVRANGSKRPGPREGSA